MAWELLAIWLIVATTVVFFIRDERRVRLERLDERARRFATAPAFRHRDPPPRQAAERPFRQDLTVIQRRFAEELRRIER